jgi:hypothetical protein
VNSLARATLLLEPMTVVGDESIGYSAKFKGDPNYCWAMKRDTVVAGCAQRRDEVLSGTLIRGASGYYSARPPV